MQQTQLTSRDVAAQLGVHYTTINRQATAHNIGSFFAGRRVYSVDDVERLRQVVNSSPGNPTWRK